MLSRYNLLSTAEEIQRLTFEELKKYNDAEAEKIVDPEQRSTAGMAAKSVFAYCEQFIK